MKFLKKLLLLALPCLIASLSAPALADAAVPPILYGSGTWQLCLSIGVFVIALALLIYFIIRIRRKNK